MRLTLVWLCACLAIYCSGGLANNGNGNVVLSLPPSLIAATEAVALRQLRQQQPEQQRQPQQSRWQKDARVLFDSAIDEPRDRQRSKESAFAASKRILPYHDDYDGELAEVEQQPLSQSLLPSQSADFNRKALSEAYDLEAAQSAPQEIAPHRGHGLDLQLATPGQHRFGGTRRCQAAGNSCPGEYNRASVAVRTRDAIARMRQQLDNAQDPYNEDGDDVDFGPYRSMNENDANEEVNSRSNNNDVFMLLTGERDLAKFLHWALQLLYPQVSTETLDSSAADSYHPGMFLWKKYNLSGHLEPPLIVDEPKYLLVRREKPALKGGYELGDNLKPTDVPFIPPRGRKDTRPNLSELLNRNEPFVPNRGKRDPVKDLFKYDDLFYPNRGKKHRDIFNLDDDPFFPHRGKKLKLSDLYTVDDPFFPNRGKRLSTAKQILRQSERGSSNNYNDNDSENEHEHENDNGNGHGRAKGDNRPQRMSTHEINGYDQSVKTSMSAADAALTQQQLPEPNNRLQSPRSVAAYRSQRQGRSIGSPGMRRRRQVKTSWPARSYLRLRQFALNAR